jgi:rhamnosyltransferase
VTPQISVIMRAKDRAHTIGGAIDAVRAQDVDVELIVVDSGSTDGTVEVARERADRLIEIAAEDFTYGGALNIGAAAASGEVHVALSAHCVLPQTSWMRRAAMHLEDPGVGATTGAKFSALGELLEGPVRQVGAPADDPHVWWGYSNHAGAWRADVWREFPFSTDLVACEDKEWSIRIRRAGKAVVMDPELYLAAKHRRHEGIPALYRRSVREGQGIQMITGRPLMTLKDAAKEWFTLQEGRSVFIQVANPYRMTELVGRMVGERQAAGSDVRQTQAAES